MAAEKMSAHELVAWRHRMRLTPKAAARVLNTEEITLYQWETERRRVPGPVLPLTRLIEKHGVSDA